MKRILSALLVAVLLLISATPAFAALPETVSPLYINTSQASVSLTISDEGLASVSIKCIGYSFATSISTETYLERQVGSSWVRVDLGTTNDVWTESVTTRYLIKSYSKAISVNGTYRATTVFTVNGTEENETFTLYSTRTYS